MKMHAIVAGVGMTTFGKHLDKGLKALGAEAVRAALADAVTDARVGRAPNGGGNIAIDAAATCVTVLTR
jgi:acetyl-CoA acetyltransferase